MREGSTLRPDVTLVAGYYSYVGAGEDQSLSDGLNADVAAMQKWSKRVVIIGDVPERNRQPVDCLLAPNASAAGCSDSLAANEAELTSLMAQIAADDSAGFIDTTGWFCYEGQCPLVVGNIITYRDVNHVSQTYAAALSGAFRSAFDLAVSRRKQ
jgi:SGNH domain (fused to AT3 domains)